MINSMKILYYEKMPIDNNDGNMYDFEVACFRYPPYPRDSGNGVVVIHMQRDTMVDLLIDRNASIVQRRLIDASPDISDSYFTRQAIHEFDWFVDKYNPRD